MIRDEIIAQFRAENPDIPDRVIPDVTLQAWCKVANTEVCTITRCINGGGSFNTVAGEYFWDLTAKIAKFYDINEYPGAGVALDDDRLEKKTPAELDDIVENWREDIKDDNRGIPEYYFRVGKEIYVECPVDAVYEMDIDAILIPNDWVGNVTPYNQLTYLEPFHYAIVCYLKMRAKSTSEKPNEASIAQKEYRDYVAWMKKELQGGRTSQIQYRQPNRMQITDRYRR